MACCRKVQEKQDRIIELNNRIATSQSRVERASLAAQKKITETNVEIRQNRVVKFFGKFFKLILLQIPLITISMVLILVFLILFNITSLIAKTIFNKEIGGIISPFAIYNNIRTSMIAKSIENMKEKIEQHRNEPK